MMQLWQFEPLDSCFFRGAKPFNAGEGGFQDSLFPPTAQTLSGVIRSSIAEAMGVEWPRLHCGEQEKIATLIGRSADDAGDLEFSGPYLINGNERLYPVPLHLLYSEKEKKWWRLEPSDKVLKTDQGMLRLPEVQEGMPEDAKPLEKAWLDASNMQRVLNGGLPVTFFRGKDLFVVESRTGIGRDNQTRMVKDGQLYFTRHVRLKGGVALGMGVNGAGDVKPASMVRLGGEGRMAHLSVKTGINELEIPNISNDVKGLILTLLTHGDFEGKSEPDKLPEDIRIESACIGKAVREGGWDYKERKPKPLKSLVPAGSSYFISGDIQRIMSKTNIGERRVFGYGEIAVGIWK